MSVLHKAGATSGFSNTHSWLWVPAFAGTTTRSPANLHVAAAAFNRPALRGRPELKMASPLDRAAAAGVADDLARCLRPRAAGLGPRPLANRAIGAVVVIAFCGRRFRAPLLAFIVVIEERALRADDPAAAVAIGLEAVLADQRTDPRRLELDRIERVGACKLDVEPGSGMPVEQRHRALRRRVPFAIDRPGKTADAAQLDLHGFCDVGLH